MEKTPITTHISKLTHEGRGIAHVDGKATFLFGGLPDEDVTFKYTHKKSNFAEGDVIEVLQASSQRVTPKCAHFSLCGGCSLQHADHALQIAHKQSVLLEQLKHFGNLSPQEILPPLTANIWGYRKKARLGVKFVAKKNTVLVGFRERKSIFLAQLDQCEVLDPRVGHLITPLRELITTLSVYQNIAQIEVAISDAEVALVFRNLKSLTPEDENKLKAFGKQHNVLIYLQPGNAESVYLLSPESRILNPESLLTYTLPDFDLKLQFHPMDFTQVNSEINRKMVKLALELLAPTKDETVLDLFCGLGNFTLPLARFAKQVIGVEGSDKMVERATANAALNNITNTEFYTADLSADFSANNWAKQTYDKILLDPPRTGAEKIIEFIPHWKAKKIVYVSCNPATLARDAGHLVKHGYHLSKAGIIDMFPHTSHVESIAVFEK